MSRRALVVVLVLLAPRSVSAGLNLWTGNGPEGGAINSLVLDPNDSRTLYAAGFKSQDGAASWTQVSSVPPGILAISASSPNVFYAAGGSTVWRSDDAGAHWSLLKDFSEPFITVMASGIAVDPTDADRVFVAMNEVTQFGQGTVWRSEDGGATWEAAVSSFPLPFFGEIAIDPRAPHAVFAATYGLLRSLDGGSTWTPATGLETGITTVVSSLAFPESAPGVVVAGKAGEGVFVSRDGGATFAAANSGLSGNALSVVDVVAVAESPSALFAATRDGLYRTDDLGGSWRKVNAETWSSLRSDPSSASTLYATNDGVFKSVDGGLHFSEVDRGLVATSVSSLARSPSGGLYAGAGNEVFRSTDSGSTWSRATVT